jgi:penicillin amidase
MLRAGSVAEMDEAMRDWVDPANNFVFADVHGSIGYLCRGKLPVRPAANAWLPVPGWDGQHEWSGFVPFEELPRERDPEAGYIVTANNRIAGDGYPYYIGLHFSPEFRARRIAHRLSALSKASVEDMAAIHGEAVSIPARSYTRLLSRVDPSDELSVEAQRRLLAWDGTMDKDLVAPSIYASFRMRLDLTLLRHVLGPLTDEALAATGRGGPIHVRMLMAHFVDLAERDDTSMLPPGYDWPSLAAQALSEGVSDLRERLGDDIDAWTWGKLHFTKPRHELSDIFPEAASLLDPPSVPMSGDGDTPHQGGFKLSQPFTPTDVSVARYVFDLSDWNNSRWVTPLGASGHPGSPHYADQVPTWGAVEMLPMLYEGWGSRVRVRGSE